MRGMKWKDTRKNGPRGDKQQGRRSLRGGKPFNPQTVI